MKKSILIGLILSLLLILQSCSKDDSSSSSSESGSSSSKYFLNLKINDDSFSNDITIWGGRFYENECITNKRLQITKIDDVDTSKYWIDLWMAYYETTSDFSTAANQSGSVKQNITNVECARNFDIECYTEVNGKELSLDTTASNFHTITSITPLSDNDFEAMYVISGKFEATYLDSNNVPYVISAEYRIPITVLK